VSETPDGRAPAPPASIRTARPRARVTWRSPWTLVVGIISIATLVYVLPPYLTFDPATARNTFLPGFSAHYALILFHVFTGAVAWVTGILQVWPWLLRKFPKVHRFSGLAYVFAGALPTTVVAVVLRTVAGIRDHSVQPGALGLYVAAVLWFGTTLLGYVRARQHRWVAHRRWMTYSVAMSLTTLWNRPVAIFTMAYFPASLPPVLEAIGWFPMILHLGIAHWWVTKRRSAVLEDMLRKTPANPRVKARQLDEAA